MVFLIFALVGTFIKSLVEKEKEPKPVTEPKFEKYPTEEKTQYSEPQKITKVNSKQKKANNAKKQKNFEDKTKYKSQLSKHKEITINVKEVSEDEGECREDISLDHDDVVRGIIMSEILESPRFKKPHRIP